MPVYRFTPQFPWTPVVGSQLPDVLLIGDSTEMRYAPHVLSALDGAANIYSLYEHEKQRLHSLFIGGPLIRPVNATSTRHGLCQLDEWLGGRSWDVNPFNWGIHDLVSPVQGEPDAQRLERLASTYASGLNSLVTRLIESEASLIFATTTPVPDGAGFIHGSVERYNEVAAGVMRRHNIEVNDLYKAVEARQEELQFENDVHFRPEGFRILGEQLASRIRAVLESRRRHFSLARVRRAQPLLVRATPGTRPEGGRRADPRPPDRAGADFQEGQQRHASR